MYEFKVGDLVTLNPESDYAHGEYQEWANQLPLGMVAEVTSVGPWIMVKWDGGKNGYRLDDLELFAAGDPDTIGTVHSRTRDGSEKIEQPVPLTSPKETKITGYNADILIMDDLAEPESSGGSCGYYDINITELGEVRCLDVIDALELTYAEANIFKEIWRGSAARRGLEKEGNTALRGAKKIQFFAEHNLQYVKDRV